MTGNLLSTLFILIIEAHSFGRFRLITHRDSTFYPCVHFKKTQPTLYDLLLIGHIPGNFMRTEIDFLSPTD